MSEDFLLIKSNNVNFDRNYCDISVFISCYNESSFIISTISKAVSSLRNHGLIYEIIIIDDCSIDNSVEVVSDYIDGNKSINMALVKNKSNMGLGYCYKLAASLSSGKYYRMMCGDDVEGKETLDKIFSCIGQFDIVIPYHNVITGKPKMRQVLSKFFTLIVNVLSGNHVAYYNGLPVFLRRDVIMMSSHTKGFGFQAELLCRCLSHGRSYVEVPVSMSETKQSGALSLKNMFSVSHVLVNIFVMRLSNWYHSK